jgi:glycogen synthase kinase 3 beta
MEYVPETAFQVIRHYKKKKKPVPSLLVKLYMYQLFRSLAYSHAYGICHRDIKPENLLVHPITGVLKLCDFGSAKILAGTNVAYICSRYYRAPELIFGATHYTCSIDIWSAGCVLGELLLERPLFPGNTSIDQLVEIIRILGNPSETEIKSMNPDYFIERPFPIVQPRSFSQVIPGSDELTIDFLYKIFRYDPKERLTAIELLVHPYFDELRDPETKLSANIELPHLFDFSNEGKI